MARRQVWYLLGVSKTVAAWFHMTHGSTPPASEAPVVDMTLAMIRERIWLITKL